MVKFFKSTGKRKDGKYMSFKEIQQDYLKNAGWIPSKCNRLPEVRAFESEEAKEEHVRKNS